MHNERYELIQEGLISYMGRGGSLTDTENTHWAPQIFNKEVKFIMILCSAKWKIEIRNASIICCKLFSIFGFSEKGKMQPRANTFHRLSFIIKMTKTYSLGNIKGNMMGCRSPLIVVKSREISGKHKWDVPNGKFLTLLEIKFLSNCFLHGFVWVQTYSTLEHFCIHHVRSGN